MTPLSYFPTLDYNNHEFLYEVLLKITKKNILVFKGFPGVGSKPYHFKQSVINNSSLWDLHVQLNQ